jgi:hypothetical protein
VTELNAQAEVDRVLAVLGSSAGAYERNPDSTIPPGQLFVQTIPAKGVAKSLSVLPSIALKGSGATPSQLSTDSPDLAPGELLGEGGMGVVHAAFQRSLRRTVAIKQPLQPEDTAALVAEARTMALIAHPNIVPVHALGRTNDGRAVLVMKQIQGSSLKDLLRDRHHEAWPRLEARWGDQEAACLGILTEVCDALTAAHARGVVHRDVKPENVMVGEFGEVYLLDWGIALRIGDTSPSALGSVVGTLGYMAPEMVLEPGSADARTDVYTLGATLHNVLTGTLRNQGTTFVATLASAMRSEPFSYGPEVAPDLARLANAATSHDRANRPATAAAFREGLSQHVRHREAMGLVQATRQAMASATRAGLSSSEAGMLLAESGASIAAACRAAPDLALTVEAHESYLRLAIARDLALENPQGARAHAARLRVEDIELKGAIDTLEQRSLLARADSEALRRARDDADTTGTYRIRVVASALVLSAFFVASIVHIRNSEGGHVMDLWRIVVSDTFGVAAVALGAWLGRSSLFGNQGNRRLTWAGLGGLVAVWLTHVVSLRLALTGEAAFILAFLVAGLWNALAALTIHRVLGVSAVVALGIAALFLALPNAIASLLPIATFAFLAALGLGIGAASSTAPLPAIPAEKWFHRSHATKRTTRK